MSAIGPTLDNIRTDLVARAGLAGINVFTAPVPLEQAGLECIAFGDARLDEVAATMGGTRDETWSVDFEIRVARAWQGSVEETIQAARDRVLEILAEIEDYLAETYVGQLPDVEIVDATLAQTFGAEGRICSLLGSLRIRNIKQS